MKECIYMWCITSWIYVFGLQNLKGNRNKYIYISFYHCLLIVCNLINGIKKSNIIVKCYQTSFNNLLKYETFCDSCLYFQYNILVFFNFTYRSIFLSVEQFCKWLIFGKYIIVVRKKYFFGKYHDDKH